MGRFIECQAAVVPWGGRPNFRRAKVGLLRKGSIVYLTIFFTSNNYCKFQIEKDLVEIFPAAIRFLDLKKDLFTRKVCDEISWSNMVREIKVLLKRDKLLQGGRAETLEKFISSIPSFNTCNLREFAQPKAPKQPSNKAVEIKGLQVLPKELWYRTSLVQLTLSNCNLSVIPQQIEQFSSTLVLLNLEHNNITRVPTTFCCKVNNLHTLSLANNQIQTLPLEIKFFHRLRDLDVSNNRLRMLPTTVSDLKRLQTLKLDNNSLSQLPAFRMELAYLDVSYNSFDGSNKSNLFEVVASDDDYVEYNESLVCPLSPKENKFPKLFEIAVLKIARCDRLLMLASEAALPETIVSTMQRDLFKCFRCSKMSILPAYKSTDILDYAQHVRTLVTTGNNHSGMTFMKIWCRSCFDSMSL